MTGKNPKSLLFYIVGFLLTQYHFIPPICSLSPFVVRTFPSLSPPSLTFSHCCCYALFSSYLLLRCSVFLMLLSLSLSPCPGRLSAVPDDVFAPNYVWKGSYNYRGRKQPMTLSITSFNTTTGRVNVSLSNGNMELLLSGTFFPFVVIPPR